jgi:hypothetical protein
MKRLNRSQKPFAAWYFRNEEDIIELYNYFITKIEFKLDVTDFAVYIYNTSL